MNCIFVDLINKLINVLIDGFDYRFDGFIGIGFGFVRFVGLNGFSPFLVFVRFVGFAGFATFTAFVGFDGRWIDGFAA